MNNDSTKHLGGGDCQAHLSNSGQYSPLELPDPSLWNSPIGRRAFLKRTGMAGVGTVTALNSFRISSVASDSAIPLPKWKIRANSGSSSNPNPEIRSGAPTTIFDANNNALLRVRWIITSEVSFSPENQGENEGWGTTATSTITVIAVVSMEKEVGGIGLGNWETFGDPTLELSHSRTVTATINPDTGNTAINWDDDTTSDVGGDGMEITLIPLATGENVATITPPSGNGGVTFVVPFNLGQSNSMDALPLFQKRIGQGPAEPVEP